MNIQHAKILRDRIDGCADVEVHEKPGNMKGFNMETTVFQCGSPACVAGHCGVLLGEAREYWNERSITGWLEIDLDAAEMLFTGAFFNSGQRARRDEVVAFLDDCIEGRDDRLEEESV